MIKSQIGGRSRTTTTRILTAAYLTTSTSRFSRTVNMQLPKQTAQSVSQATTTNSNTTLKPINLQLGWPSPSLFPTSALHRASSTTLTNPSLAASALIYGPDPGHQPLRESLAAWLTSFYNPGAGAIPASNIFISNGASQTLEVILAKFTDRAYTRAVFMVEPTYFLACPIFEDAGLQGRLRGVPEDEEGVDVEFLRREVLRMCEAEDVSRSKSEDKYPKLYRFVFYAVPTFANPSGKVMSVRRRRELLELAREVDALAITDDVYDMLRWPVGEGRKVGELPPPPPRLVDLDRQMEGQSKFGNTVSNGSFSKIVAPGTRVGWVEGTESFVHVLSMAGAIRSGGSPGHMSSVFIDQMLRNGDMERHIAGVLVPTYRKRNAVMMQAIEKHLVPLGVEIMTGRVFEHDVKSVDGKIVETGGFFVWLALPDDVQPARQVANIALDHYGLKFAHGGMMLAAGDPGSIERAKTSFGRGVRLSWSWLEEEDINEGIERFSQVIEDIRQGKVRKKAETSNSEGLDLE